MLLNGSLALHQPGCDGRRCVPNECIADVERFARSIISAHERGGSKRNGSLDRRGMTFTAGEREDLLAYLVAEAWRASQKFRPGDDGRRPGNRLAGYVLKTLHFRLVDFVRQTRGSTRYPAGLKVTELVEYRPDVYDQPHWDPEYDGDDDYGLDLKEAPPGTREALELLQPWLDGELDLAAQVAGRAQVKPSRVTRAVEQVRAAARRQDSSQAARNVTRSPMRWPTYASSD